MQVSEALKTARESLSWSDSAQLDAELLLCNVLNCDRSKLYAYPEHRLSDDLLLDFNHQLKLRQQGHPIAHLLSKKEFWSLELEVSKDTLIPRPETEQLVETALSCVPNRQSVSILDLGTGSGAIAIAIASELPQASITATDISQPALEIARRNADTHKIKNIRFIHSNWFSAIDQQYDVIISNPPYISFDDPHLKQGDVRYEPKLALVSGLNGLCDLTTISKNAVSHLKADGWLLLEHGFEQGEAVRRLLEKQAFRHIATLQDYNELDRVTIGQV